jgi:hypothetical protein
MATTSYELVITRDDSTRIIVVSSAIGIAGPPGPCGGLVIDVSGGIVGVCGSTGINVTAPVLGEQFISLNITDPGIVDPYTPLTHTAFTSASADTGTARKIAFLQADGGITFDYIRNYDVFKPSDFLLQISSFTISSLSTTQLIGNATFLQLDGKVASASYTQTVNSATISILNSSGNEENGAHGGFPQILTAPFTSYTFDNLDAISYPASPATQKILRLTAVGASNTATSDITLTFVNNVYYGVNTSTSANITTILAGTSSTVLSNSRARTFTVNAGTNEYIYYSYPSRLGTATFTVGGFEGGFSLISTQSHTNSLGFTENYYVYRSDNKSLGSTTVVVS